MIKPLVEIDSASFGYNQREVVRIESLQLNTGICMGIFGPNGSGKSTLVRGMTGLLPALAGTVRRKSMLKIGYLPQHREIDLSWPMTGFDAASLPLSANRWFGWLTQADRSQLREAMSRLEVETIGGESFARLSGGQQQRLLLAGTLAADPELLVLDEPTDGLDVQSRQRLIDLLGDLARVGLSVVVISHDVQDLLELCQTIAWVHPGDGATEPATVEMIQPQVLAERILHKRKAI